MIKSKTVAVVVTYNRIELLKECVDALLHQTEPIDILIVNNASTDGTKDYLNTLNNIPDHKFYVYNMSTNLNGAGGYNYGIKEACKFDYEYIWLMDDDTIVNQDTLSKLYSADIDLGGKWGFLSSKVLWKDGSICKTNVQRKRVARRVSNFADRFVKVDYCSFVSCFLKKCDIYKLGLPIKDFIIWTDDLEYTRRFTKKMTGYLINDSVVTHKCKDNFGVNIVKDTSDRLYRYKYIYRNDVYCFKREGIRGILYLIIRNIYHIIRVLLFSQNDKFLKISYIVNGFIDGFKFNPKIEYAGV